MTTQTSLAGQTAIALDYAQLIDQVAEQEKLKREIEIAKEVQAQLFPQALPALRTLEYTGVCKAARGVGGDYYDFLLLAPEKLGIALGDISGKGISAALLMASLQALLRSHAPMRSDAPDRLIEDINRLMCSSTDSSKYATFFYGLYDDTCRTLSYVNAGHNPPMLCRPDNAGVERRVTRNEGAPMATGATMQPFDSPEIARLETGGTVVGLIPDAVYEQETIQLYPGDFLVIFSDGISEAMNINEEEFGEARLAALIARNKSLSVNRLCDLILKEIGRFAGEAPQHDDLTLVVAKVL